jgi:oligopeptidase A
MMFESFPVDLATDFPQRLEALLDQQRSAIHAIALLRSPSYENTLKPLQDLEEELNLFFTPLSHLNSVLNSDATQKAYEAAIPLLSSFHSELTQNEMLFKKIEGIAVEDPESMVVTKNTVRDFILAGAKLSKNDKQRMKTIDLRLSEMGNAFSQNLLDATHAHGMVLTDPADVAELPDSDLEAAIIKREGHVAYRFTLQLPSYLAYMTYGSNRARREELYLAYNTRAPENGTVINELLRLRDEKAKLLGYTHYAHYALQTRDAQNENAVLAFLETLGDTALPHAKHELATLQKYALDLDGVDDLAPWDTAYYSEKLKKTMFDLDDALTKPYFEQSRVLGGLLSMVSELFDVAFKPLDVAVWHPQVHVYDLYEKGSLAGRIYFDLEARPEKRGGAWMHDWETHYTDSKGQSHLPSAFVVANFSPATDAIPSLLRHDDVVTLFHEMGHALHHLFGRAHERSVSGINGVAWDVVEFPSQFLENFAYEAPILRRFAFHYETQEPIPDAWIDQIKSSKNFQAALGLLRQVEFSLFDFQLHQHLYQGDQVQELLDLIREKTALITPPTTIRFQHGFAHIFSGGYAAGYYSYKWAEVLSADAFFQCLDPEGDFDQLHAHGYRRHILSQGGIRPMNQLFYDWLGRTPSPQCLLQLYGIETETSHKGAKAL